MSRVPSKYLRLERERKMGCVCCKRMRMERYLRWKKAWCEACTRAYRARMEEASRERLKENRRATAESALAAQMKWVD